MQSWERNRHVNNRLLILTHLNCRRRANKPEYWILAIQCHNTACTCNNNNIYNLFLAKYDLAHHKHSIGYSVQICSQRQHHWHFHSFEHIHVECTHISYPGYNQSLLNIFRRCIEWTIVLWVRTTCDHVRLCGMDLSQSFIGRIYLLVCWRSAVDIVSSALCACTPDTVWSV